MNSHTIAKDVEQFLARGGQINVAPPLEFQPYHAPIPRKPDPDIAERHRKAKKSGQRRGSQLPDEYLSTTDILASMDWGMDAAAQRRLERLIDRGEFPKADIEVEKFGKVFKGWLPETIEAHEQSRKSLE